MMNLKSGGGKAERFALIDECRRRGIEPVVLQRGDHADFQPTSKFSIAVPALEAVAMLIQDYLSGPMKTE